MADHIIAGKKRNQWLMEYPLLKEVISARRVFWRNPQYANFTDLATSLPFPEADLMEAELRLERFAPYLAKVFPETRASQGLVESPLVKIPNMQDKLGQLYGHSITGTVLLKCDNQLPISGSIKARGGIYEVLKHAEQVAVKNRLLRLEDGYEVFASDKLRSCLAQYALAVGSTGNLGLSIGIMGVQLGFKVFVHMSADAKQWKKDLLRNKGVTVIEHRADYSQAVQEGRKQAQADPKMHFVDDENSIDLFMGYAVAAKRLQRQLDALQLRVDDDHPLFVYLPCGVGGSPGGITFGLKSVYHDHVHCFFAEPTHAPCMLLGLMTGQQDRVSVRDFGIDNRTEADGLAVGRASGFVGKAITNLISGVYTVADEDLHMLLATLADTEHIATEPSAMAGMPGPVRLLTSPEGQAYTDGNGLRQQMARATHMVWATGGSMVPPAIMQAYYDKGLRLLNSCRNRQARLAPKQ